MSSSKMSDLDEIIQHCNGCMDELEICGTVLEMEPEDAPYVKQTRAKLQEALETKRRIDELLQTYECLQVERAALVKGLEMRLRLTDMMRAFQDGLQSQSDLGAVGGADERPAAELERRAGEKGRVIGGHILPVSEEEFARVGKYSKGRFTLAKLNELVEAFNAVLDAKYALLALPKHHLKDAQLAKVTTWRNQETTETRGLLRFVTGDDLKTESSAFESRHAVVEFAAILLRCDRLREIRGPQRIVRYVVA